MNPESNPIPLSFHSPFGTGKEGKVRVVTYLLAGHTIDPCFAKRQFTRQKKHIDLKRKRDKEGKGKESQKTYSHRCSP